MLALALGCGDSQVASFDRRAESDSFARSTMSTPNEGADLTSNESLVVGTPLSGQEYKSNATREGRGETGEASRGEGEGDL